jgi:hypothetical protein
MNMHNAEINLEKLNPSAKKAYEILIEKGRTLAEVEVLFEKKRKELEKREYVETKSVWKEGKKKLKFKIEKTITLMQSDSPFKMFVLQELVGDKGYLNEIRIGYYIISPKKLQNEGKLMLWWGQYNPHLPKQDLLKLLKLAEDKGIL